jgi:hypothetical protein
MMPSEPPTSREPKVMSELTTDEIAQAGMSASLQEQWLDWNQRWRDWTELHDVGDQPQTLLRRPGTLSLRPGEVVKIFTVAGYPSYRVTAVRHELYPQSLVTVVEMVRVTE